MRRTPPPPVTGTGDLRLGSRSTPVTYVHHQGRGAGSVSGDPEMMRAAFVRGDTSLHIEDDVVLSVVFVGYTAGSDTAYFDVVKPQRT